ncbi:site-specific integrase, partial [Rhizobium sp. L74/93]|nr:hypothetical protein [Rhizobium sp. L58/93]MBO9188230.1 hypothetical protein [Rhizobium sp. E27B/91]
RQHSIVDFAFVDLHPANLPRAKAKILRFTSDGYGDALDAAREALDGRSGSTEAVFSKYGKPGGGNVASAALMKNLRKVVKDPKVTVHSLRHTLQDRMIVAGISEHDRHIILGHSVTGEANRYGSKEARLVATTEAMRLLLPSKNAQKA